MIRSLLALALVVTSASFAEEGQGAPTSGRPDDPTLEGHRSPLEALTERMLGSASRAVRFDWRKKTVAVGVMASQLHELNNFASARVGGFARLPLGDLLAEVGFSRVFVWGSDSTDKLALTPYRQLGRPSRFELDLNFGYPLAEGVVTPRLAFISAAELVLSVNLGLRYEFYAHALDGATAGEVAGAIFAPRLTAKELANMAPLRLPGMQLDDTRYGVLAGFTLDVYFQPGLFLSPRVMVSVPLFTSSSTTSIAWWWELTMSLGWML